MPLPPPFRDSTGAPGVQLSVCVVADILGFSRRVLDCPTINESQKLCQQIDAILGECREFLADPFIGSDVSHPPTTGYKLFSDTLVIGLTLEPGIAVGEPQIGRAMEQASRYQVVLALASFFVRGGLSVGELHLSDDLVFGKALIEAHEIESRPSAPPRIVLCENAKHAVRHHLSFYGQPSRSPQAQDIIVDETDSEWFVNYLNACNYSEYCSDFGMLEQHRDRIQSALGTYSTDTSICAKYEWLRDYHNFFCEHQTYGSEECPVGQEQIESVLINVPGDRSHAFRYLTRDDVVRLGS